MTFQVGDKVIYPNHGLGIVERIEEKTILGTTCGFFHLRIVSNDTTVLVPVANVDGVGLRKAITVEERVDQALEKCFVVKARSMARTASRPKITKAVKAVPVVATARRAAARAS